jgi:histidine kinase
VIEDAYRIIEFKNQKITDSIRYARTIQRNILPSEATLASTFREFFVIYRPKDVVSGDFYWLLKVENKHFLAVVDCTGHGVPGAFMSMIGHTLLYRIIKLKGITNPARILEMLHAEVRVVLRQKNTTNIDGMDVCLCSIEKTNNESEFNLVFSGAKLPLYYYANGSLEMLEEDRKSIGGIQSKARQFTNKEIRLHSGAILYLSTDGFRDQNNAKRKKFGENQLTKLMEKNAKLPLDEQKKIYEEALGQHQSHTEQRDDITLLGLKL